MPGEVDGHRIDVLVFDDQGVDALVNDPAAGVVYLALIDTQAVERFS